MQQTHFIKKPTSQKTQQSIHNQRKSNDPRKRNEQTETHACVDAELQGYFEG